MTINIIIIDDRELFRAGLTSLINDNDLNCVVQSTPFSDYMKLEKQMIQIADIVIFSSENTDNCIQHQCEEICSFFEGIPLIILANNYSKKVILSSIESGVAAFYSKSISPDILQELISEIASKHNFTDIKLDTNVRETLINKNSAHDLFTNAETEVIRLVCQQKSSAEISDDLGISIRTVESRKRNMMQKTNSKNIIGVVLEYLKYYQKVD